MESLSHEDYSFSSACWSSYLSPYSHSLLCCQYLGQTDSSEVCNDFIIKFDFLPDDITKHLLNEDYRLAMTSFRPFMRSIATCFQNVSTYDLYTKYGNFLSWLSDPCEYLELHSRLSRQEAPEKLLIGLRLTALIDFSLNALIWNPNTKSPNMLKDTLQSEKLAGLLGKNCILILKLLFGPVHSLNLRNILWHGFLSSKDMLQLDKYLIPFIFAVILSIGYRLDLPNVSANMCKNYKRPSSIESLELCECVIPVDVLNPPSTTFLFDLAKWHFTLPVLNLEYVKFIDSLLHNESPRYLDVLCLCIICLNMVVRCQFANFIKWPEGMITSEDRFFLTIDSILDFQFTDIFSCLPSLDLMSNLNTFCDLRIIDILCDLFNAQNGPRLKDKVSHGELWQTRSIEFVHNELIVPSDKIFCTAAKLVYFCLAALIVPGMTEDNNDLSSSALSWTQLYKPSYNLCNQFMQNLLDLKLNYTRISTHAHNLSNFIQNENPSHEEFKATFTLWFPNNSYPDLTDSIIPVLGQHWPNMVSWSYLATETKFSFWSFRPTSVLNRLNLLLQKYNHAFSLVDQHFNRYANINLDSLPTRRYNTFQRSITSLDHLQDLTCFLLCLTRCIWFYWLAGFCHTIPAKLDMITKNSENLKMRAALIEYLDKTADKLVMWTTKSQWELITEYFGNFSLPKPEII